MKDSDGYKIIGSQQCFSGIGSFFIASAACQGKGYVSLTFEMRKRVSYFKIKYWYNVELKNLHCKPDEVLIYSPDRNTFCFARYLQFVRTGR